MEEPMPASFKVGDIVELKSGGPKMTVTELFDEDDSLRTSWFAGAKMEKGIFPFDALTAVSGATSK
jgi:uncharacterized protein YodC (DUF2158 family)